MRSRVFKSCLSVFLVFVLLALPGISPAAANAASGAVPYEQGAAVIKNKEEVVYAVLDALGNADSVYAVNHFVVTIAGDITDYGSYSSVANLTTTESLAQNGDAVSFHAEKGHFYYQGDMAAAELPWDVDISYTLDGVRTAPQDLAGRSGKLGMQMVTRRNEKVDAVFYDNYMLQVSVTLDTEKCGDIEAPGATIAGAGKNTVVTYVVMPGRDGNISLSSTVRDFAMAGIQISAMPLSLGFDMPDTGDMVDDMNTLSDAISGVNDGVKDLNGGVARMNKGAADLVSGSSGFKNGLSQLSGSLGQLITASGQIKSALAGIVYSLDHASGGFDPTAFAQLPDGLDQLAQGLDGISGGLTRLKGGFSDAKDALGSAISHIPDISQSDIASLSAAVAGLDEDQQHTLSQLLDAYTAAQTVKGTYYGPHGNDGVKAAFDSVEAGLSTMSGSVGTISQTLSGMAAQIRAALSASDFAAQMQQLKDGLTALSDNYGQFHSGLVGYTDGVKALSSNYGKLHTGLVSLSDGIADLYSGTKELYSGTRELDDHVADLPDTMQTKMDDLMKEYDKSDFQPVSFISAKNTNVSLVQFVFKTAAIEAAQESALAEPEPSRATVWDRFLALFRPKE